MFLFTFITFVLFFHTIILNTIYFYYSFIALLYLLNTSDIKHISYYYVLGGSFVHSLAFCAFFANSSRTLRRIFYYLHHGFRMHFIHFCKFKLWWTHKKDPPPILGRARNDSRDSALNETPRRENEKPDPPISNRKQSWEQPGESKPGQEGGV